MQVRVCHLCDTLIARSWHTDSAHPCSRTLLLYLSLTRRRGNQITREGVFRQLSMQAFAFHSFSKRFEATPMYELSSLQVPLEMIT